MIIYKVYITDKPQIFSYMNRNILIILILILLSISCGLNAQVGIGTTDPDSSVILDIKSPSKGILLPRVVDYTSASKREGSLVYDSVAGKIKCYYKSQWLSINPLTTDANDNVTAPANMTINGTSVSAPNATTIDAINATVTARKFEGYGTIPIGGIIMWSGPLSDLPDNWKLCDGTLYGTVQTPDLKGRFIAGYSGSGEYSSFGAAPGGGDHITLTTDNLPTHTHDAYPIQVSTDPGHKHTVYFQHADRSTGASGVIGNIVSSYDPNGGYASTSTSGAHNHSLSGSTHPTGGAYTYTPMNNPPKHYVGCIIWQYSCSTSDGTINASEDLSTAGMPMVSETNAVTLDWAPEYSGYRVWSSGFGESLGYTEYQHTTDFTVSSCTLNSGYDSTHPDCLDPLHDPTVADGVPIRVNEHWDVQPFDNRPAYYVLAFIMRIR